MKDRFGNDVQVGVWHVSVKSQAECDIRRDGIVQQLNSGIDPQDVEP